MIDTKGVNDWLNWCNISWHFPPLSLWTDRYSLVFCPKGNARDRDCQVKFTPEKLPLHTHRRKTTQFFLTLSKKPEKKTRLCGLALVRDKLSSLCSRGQCITNISGRWKLLSSFHLCLPPEYSDGITHSSALCRADGIRAIRPSAGSAETKEINSFVITETQQRFVECFCWRLRGSSVEAESP